MTATEMLHAAARDPAALRRAVGDAEIVPLALVLTQLTGDRGVLDLVRPYVTGPWVYTQSVPTRIQARIRVRLVETIETMAAAGAEIADAPDPALIPALLEAATGHQLGPEYEGVFKDEASFGAGDARSIDWTNSPPARLRDFKVVVIGTGFSGVLAAIKLKLAGIPYVVIEKNHDVGGTWLENVYPGIGVDTPCHFFSYAFEPNPDWSSYFTTGEEILNYIRATARKHGVLDGIRFGEEVTSAIYDPATCRWTVSTRTADGVETRETCNAVISCVGALNRPSIPEIAGLDTFQGPAMHTAQWDPAVDVTGKNVVMIGNGASGVQVAPTIAADVKRLTVIQRSPHWLIRHPLYHEQVSGPIRWAMRHIPFYSNWFRWRLFYAGSDLFHPTLSMDPEWEHKDVSLNAANHRLRGELMTYIRDELATRPDLWDKVTPRFPPFGKRMLRDNNWYKMLLRDNVDLVTDRVEAITPDGVTAGGQHIPADVIIFATGFQAARIRWPMDIRGRSGTSLRDIWGPEDARAHLGITVPDFPNFFMCYGPNTNQAHGGSAVFGSEVQVRYIMLALRHLIESGHDALEVKEAPFLAYNAKVDEKLATMSWSHPGVTSWYKNKAGRVVMNLPWKLVDYRNMLAEFADEDYDFTRATAG